MSKHSMQEYLRVSILLPFCEIIRQTRKSIVWNWQTSCLIMRLKAILWPWQNAK